MSTDTEIKISSERLKNFDIQKIERICKKYNFSLYDILSLAYAESSFRPGVTHLSGAKGMYQMKDWAVRRTGLLNLNTYDVYDSTELACSFLDILRRVDYPKIKDMNFLDLSDFEKMALLYHYGLTGYKEIYYSGDIPEETKIYLKNITKGRYIIFSVLLKKN